MNSTRKMFRCLCFVLLISLLLSHIVYAGSEDCTIGSMNKTVYENLSVDQIASDYQDNAFRASNNYKDSFLGIIGEIESIAANGKQITLKPSSSKMSFTCDCSDKKHKSC